MNEVEDEGMMDGHVFDGGLDETRRRVVGKRWGIIGANPKAKTGTEKKASQTLTRRNPRTPQYTRCRGYLEFFGGSRPWRSTPADSGRTRLGKARKDK